MAEEESGAVHHTNVTSMRNAVIPICPPKPLTNTIDTTNMQISIISSDDDEINASMVSSGSDFEGFASTAPSNLNLKRRSTSTGGDNIQNFANSICDPMDDEKERLQLCDEEENDEDGIPAKKGKASDELAGEGENAATVDTMDTAQDQIVEINSNSTTNSQREKRLLLRSRSVQNKTSLILQSANTDIYSTESTEFPVSSPSNPQLGGFKFMPRTSLLKNTLPGSSLERLLENIKESNPPMVARDKINFWKCSEEFSDVEDVQNFDDAFKEREEASKLQGTQVNDEEPNEHFSFKEFLERIKRKPNEKRNRLSFHNSDKPTTSAMAQCLQKRLKPLTDAELKRRQKLPTENQNNYVLSSTSSEKLDDDHYRIQKKKFLTQKTPQKILIYDKVLCPTSSEDSSRSGSIVAVASKKKKLLPLNNDKQSNKGHVPDSSPIKLHWTTDEESVFKLSRLNREIDKQLPTNIIQLRQDFRNEKKNLHLREKAHEIFKRPILPERYHQDNDNSYKNNHNNSNNNNSSKMNLIETTPLAEEASEGTEDGAFHQQYEFCNSLGLTAMSTVTAVVEATNDLAKYTLARRSLRVRQQQKEKKERNEQKEKTSTVTNSKEESEGTESQSKDDKPVSVPSSPEIERFNKRTITGQSIVNGSINSSPSTISPKSNNSKKQPEIKIEYQFSNNNSGLVKRNSIATKRKISTEAGNDTSDETTPCPEFSGIIHQLFSGDRASQSIEQNGIEDSTGKTQLLKSVSSSPQSYHSHSHLCQPETAESQQMSNRCPQHTLTYNDVQMSLQAARQTQPKVRIVDSIDTAETMKRAEKSPLPSKQLNAIQSPSVNNSPTNSSPRKTRCPVKAETERKESYKTRKLLNGARRTVLKKSKKRKNKPHKSSQKYRMAINTSDVVTRRSSRNMNRYTLRHHSKYVGDADRALKRIKNASRTKMANKKVKPTDKNIDAKNSVQFHNGYIESPSVSQVPNAAAATIDDTKDQVEPPRPTIVTKDSSTQINSNNLLYYLRPPAKMQTNPLNKEHGEVLHIYYELDILIVVQQALISFFKYSKVLKVLNANRMLPSDLATEENACDSSEWINLGECERLVYDAEIPTTYLNRICHNISTPIYVEMRCHPLSKEHRDCELLTAYVNVYYYNEEEGQVKLHSVHLDTMQSLPNQVVYTTLTESRYFVACYPKQNALGRIRTSICKYSLTPQLDSLASIRDFKHMEHVVQYIECLDTDKLLGFGATQLTIWDHRSGDVLMNYDLELPLGRNLGTIYYPIIDIGQSNVIHLFQFIPNADGQPVLMVIHCNASDVMPSHRILSTQILPGQYADIVSAVRTSDHLIVTARNGDELWLNYHETNAIIFVPARQTQHYYARGRAQIIELNEHELSIVNLTTILCKHVLNP